MLHQARTLFAVTIVSVVILACQTPDGSTDRTGSGVLAGGAIGAGTGAIIGSATRHAGEGALIGGAIGAITGGLVGRSMDQAEEERLRRESPETLTRLDQGRPLALADIKALAKAGVSDDVILSQIRNSRVVYRLSAQEIIDLHEAGVSNRVIDFMVNTPSLYRSYPVRRYYY